MTNEQLQEFARVGAEARLKTIAQERHAILTAFPELQDGAARDGDAVPAARPRKRRRMSAAERKAVGARMRAYWANRRTAKTGATTIARTRKRNGGMSIEARQAHAERMRAYWAKRRAVKAAADGDASQRDTAPAANGTSRRPSSRSGRKRGAPVNA